MTEAEAKEAARRVLLRHGIIEGYAPIDAARRIIEVVQGAPVEGRPQRPGAVRDALAWVVTLTHRRFFVEVALDDATGDALRLIRSR